MIKRAGEHTNESRLWWSHDKWKAPVNNSPSHIFFSRELNPVWMSSRETEWEDSLPYVTQCAI